MRPGSRSLLLISGIQSRTRGWVFSQPTYPGRTGQGETGAEHSLPLFHLL